MEGGAHPPAWIIALVARSRHERSTVTSWTTGRRDIGNGELLSFSFFLFLILLVPDGSSHLSSVQRANIGEASSSAGRTARRHKRPIDCNEWLSRNLCRPSLFPSDKQKKTINGLINDDDRHHQRSFTSSSRSSTRPHLIHPSD